MARATIRPSDRFRIFQRDGFCCRYCGAAPEETELQLDHLIPVAKGGDDSYLNLITSCRLCNAGKGQNAAERVPIPVCAVENTKGYADRLIALRLETLRYLKADLADSDACWELIVQTVKCSKVEVLDQDIECVRKLRNEFSLDKVTEWCRAFVKKGLRMKDFCRWMHGCAKCERGE